MDLVNLADRGRVPESRLVHGAGTEPHHDLAAKFDFARRVIEDGFVRDNHRFVGPHCHLAELLDVPIADARGSGGALRRCDGCAWVLRTLRSGAATHALRCCAGAASAGGARAQVVRGGGGGRCGG